MKKIIIFASVIMMLNSCSKNNEVKPQKKSITNSITSTEDGLGEGGPSKDEDEFPSEDQVIFGGRCTAKLLAEGYKDTKVTSIRYYNNNGRWGNDVTFDIGCTMFLTYGNYTVGGDECIKCSQ